MTPTPDFHDRIRTALAITPASSSAARTIDLTTIGARSGRPHRIEIWFYRAFGEIYLTTTPARRDWYANIAAHPDITLHLKNGIRADVPARGTPVLEEREKRRILADIVAELDRPENPAGLHGRLAPLEAWMTGSPLVHVSPDVDRARPR